MNSDVPFSYGKICTCCKQAVFTCRQCDAELPMDVSEPLDAGLELPWISDRVATCPQCSTRSRLHVSGWSDFGLSDRMKLEQILQRST